MRRRNRGVIVQVGSALAYRSIPLQAAYCGAKSAVRGFAIACSRRLRSFSRAGTWKVRFNSGAKGYDPDFADGDSFDVNAREGDKDGLRFNGNVGIGPYSVVILSQD
jgi:NAD(P)-dependent dehydrogenase (short-subunit alcohol dehydrogenase family)